MDALGNPSPVEVECPLCGVHFNIKGSGSVDWLCHLTDHHIDPHATPIVSRCVCGFECYPSTWTTADKASDTSYSLIKHLASLTPSERRDHFLLHQMGAEIQEFDE